jgi:bilin biosynthesis protein
MAVEERVARGLRSDDREAVSEAIDELEEVLRRKEWTTRMPPAVLDLLSSGDEEIRRKGSWVVGKFAQNKVEGDYPLDRLAALLSDPGEETRENAAWAIGELASMGMGGPGEAGSLAAVLGDGSSQVRGMAAWALGRLAERREIRPLGVKAGLEALLRDKSEYVRHTAAWALERF